LQMGITLYSFANDSISLQFGVIIIITIFSSRDRMKIPFFLFFNTKKAPASAYYTGTKAFTSAVPPSLTYS